MTRKKTAKPPKALLAAASLLKLKEEGLERLNVIKSLYTKAHAALAKKGSQDKSYLKYQEKISEEMMGIRFTSKTIERLCESVRGNRSKKCVPASARSSAFASIPCACRVHTSSRSSTGNELKPRLGSTVNSPLPAARPTAPSSRATAPNVKEEQKKLLALQDRIGIPLKELKDINKQMSTGEAKARRAQARNDRSQPASGHFDRQEIHQPRLAVSST